MKGLYIYGQGSVCALIAWMEASHFPVIDESLCWAGVVKCLTLLMLWMIIALGEDAPGKLLLQMPKQTQWILLKCPLSHQCLKPSSGALLLGLAAS